MRKRSWKRALAAATAASALLAVAGPLAPGAAAATCMPKTNVEAIIDDSLSMAASDSNKLRVQGLNLLIDTLPGGTTLGAIEFGSGSTFLGIPAASPVFKPEPVGPNAAAMKGALAATIDANNGATDYNGAFALADSENPNAQARIFLTDGAHNVDEYKNGHLAHNVPTYVIGFGEGLSGVEDQARLERIAAETRGKYYALTDSSQLQAVMNSIGAALTCQTPPRSFTDQLAAGQAKPHAVAVAAVTKSVQIVLTWASPLDRFKLVGLRLVRRGKPVAVAARPKQRSKRPRKLKVVRQNSRTFSVVEVRRLSKGRLRFRVKAVKVGSGEPKVTLTTQVSQKKKQKKQRR